MSSTHRSIRGFGGAPAAQRGVVLVVALIFLLLLSIIAVAASSRSLLQERMAGGLLNAQRAEMSAQTALRGAEWRLWSTAANVGTTLGCGTSLFQACYKYSATNPNPDAVAFQTKPGWDGITTNPGAYVEYKGSDGGIDFTATANGKLASNPRYIVEDMGPTRAPGSGPQHESGETGPYTGGTGKPTLEMYRITARATGGDKNTVVVLQSTFDAQTQ
jgi:type IV pilus assembly protein PilX